ncbi:MAG: response regulator transcription factor [Butyricicoccus pullicaecorum]|nr:response regulator transcription factor [Butyricicoccus pullicaecorum]
MLRIGICDDAIESRFALHSALERLSSGCICYEFSSGEGVLSWLQKHPDTLNLLFLDIEMNGISGMETARQIRALQIHIPIVFLTGYADYVFDGYSVGAFDYLMKPLKTDKLAQVLTRVQEQQEQVTAFVVQNHEGIYRIPFPDIRYFFSDRRLIHLVTVHTEYTFYDKLNRVEECLPDEFIRIHQRYLVRIGAIDRIENQAVFLGSIRLPISRANRQSVLESCARGLLL